MNPINKFIIVEDFILLIDNDRKKIKVIDNPISSFNKYSLSNEK